jgi:hypothetical protein
MTTCEKCGQPCEEKDLLWREVRRQTLSSPAEYDPVGCTFCVGELYDEAYERAAAKYDGTGRDWR